MLKKLLIGTLFLGSIVAAAPQTARADAYEIDAGHSALGFSVRHLMVSNARGTFTGVTGTVDINDKDLTKSTIDVSIDAGTINTNEPKRDEHLKSPDFFDVAKFPKITFKSKKVAKAGKLLKVTGDLTIHGVTKEVVLDVEGPTPLVKDPWGNSKRGASATAKINRKDFGLGWNKALETGGVVVGEEVKINLEVELLKKATPTPPQPVPPPPT